VSVPHDGKIKSIRYVVGQYDAQKPTAMSSHEAHRSRVGSLRRKDQVTMAMAVAIVEQHGAPAALKLMFHPINVERITDGSHASTTSCR
jgi:hypothetical protein